MNKRCQIFTIDISRLLLIGGIDYSAVSVLRRRLKAKMSDDKVVRDRYKKVEQYIKHTYKSKDLTPCYCIPIKVLNEEIYDDRYP